ncbi:MAG: hypothetical protein JRJ69_00990 [Deltaproteobacteria bacterium]|nr:hypothetical protein [Deltaproteobacteria bacterium]MBW1736142.1 hypothetical protein [Deltaproteobacteria bacterium]MBW1908470.1 hypothetical protein [Deltaproteobacteria bacterium]MBW2032521.1 hypothetical protein [Deltaproteobacteria bacterium]MBW2113448.1 hypothetical protein [Deltaproteobacteria bacterium]
MLLIKITRIIIGAVLCLVVLSGSLCHKALFAPTRSTILYDPGLYSPDLIPDPFNAGLMGGGGD